MKTLGDRLEPSLKTQKGAEKSSSSLWNSAFSHIVLQIDTKAFYELPLEVSVTPGQPLGAALDTQQAPVLSQGIRGGLLARAHRAGW